MFPWYLPLSLIFSEGTELGGAVESLVDSSDAVAAFTTVGWRAESGERSGASVLGMDLAYKVRPQFVS